LLHCREGDEGVVRGGDCCIVERKMRRSCVGPADGLSRCAVSDHLRLETRAIGDVSRHRALRVSAQEENRLLVRNGKLRWQCPGSAAASSRGKPSRRERSFSQTTGSLVPVAVGGQPSRRGCVCGSGARDGCIVERRMRRWCAGPADGFSQARSVGSLAAGNKRDVSRHRALSVSARRESAAGQKWQAAADRPG
jgi:hypothetical protein